MTNIFETKTEQLPEQKPVKTAQSLSEMRDNLRPGGSDNFDRSMQHVERPRYGHKV